MRALGIRRPGGTHRGMRGASLLELLVALVLFGIVGTATFRALDRQARLHSGIQAILEARAQHAAAHEAVAVELRGASSASGDIGPLSDTSVVFRLPIGGGVACAITSGITDLAPDSVATGQEFARFRTAPQAGDTAWLLDEGATDASSDDVWLTLHLTSVTRASGNCAASPLVDPVLDAGRPSWRLTVAGAMPPTVVAGATVRLTRAARFALYRSGTESWLGFTERNPGTGAWVTIQPVSGPYLPVNAALPAASGFALQGRDSSGAPTMLAGPGSPAALSIATRTRTTGIVRMDGLARARYADSLHSLIALRNAR